MRPDRQARAACVRVLKILATFSHVSIRTAIVLESLFILSLETLPP